MTGKWWQPSKPGEIKPTPWLHPKAIEYLESLLTPEMEVLEFGAGGSTLWFAERVEFVTTYEHDPSWLNFMHMNAPRNAIIMASFPFELVVNEPCDLLFIDGEPVVRRKDWIEAAPRLVKPGGYVVLDNANRPEYAGAREDFAKHAQLIHTVDGNEPPCVYLITEFWKLCE